MKRRWRISRVVAVFCLITVVMSPLSHAGTDDDTAALKQELVLLRERIAALEARLEKTAVAPAGTTTPAATPETGVQQTITSFAKEIQVHGYVDGSYTLNTNTPVDPNPRVNNLRIFDTDANGFMLNMAQINFEKPVSFESPVGFRIDLDFGQDAKLIHSAGLGESNQPFDLQQAYAQLYLPYHLPLAHTLTFKVGKFATLHGAEVIESPSNWNFSRSFLFGYAIPFTHTGVRAYIKPFENIPVETYVGLVNGWDQVTDNNRAKTVETMVAITPTDRLSFAIAGMFGPERTDSNTDMRNLIDFVLTYKITDKLTFKLNYDYGWEKNAASVAAGLENPKDGTWDGVAAYLKYDIFDWWSIAGRGEYFHDRDGVRTGFITSSFMPISDLELCEFTVTNEWKLWKNLIARFEYRYDKASGQVFYKNKTTANNQSTIAGEIIYSF